MPLPQFLSGSFASHSVASQESPDRRPTPQDIRGQSQNHAHWKLASLHVGHLFFRVEGIAHEEWMGSSSKLNFQKSSRLFLSNGSAPLLLTLDCELFLITVWFYS
jgi:hypothetical protein